MTDTLPHTMRYIATDGPGAADTMRIAHGPLPIPGDDDVLIAVKHAGVNRPDILQRQGSYAPPPGASAVMGLEVAGTVAAVGANARQWQVGDRVVALTPGGGYAEYCVAPAAHCLPVPCGWDMAAASAIPENYFTVWVNVFSMLGLKTGETFLVHGGSSGIGLAAIQLARAFGATVFTTAGSDEKSAFCRTMGAEHAFNYRTQDWSAEIAALTQKKGVDVILDMVGGDYINRNLRILALEGRYGFIGFMGGPSAMVDFRHVMMKRQTITGSTLRARPDAQKAAIAAQLREQAWPLFENGRLKVTIQRRFPLEAIADAHRLMESGALIGKIVIDVNAAE